MHAFTERTEKEKDALWGNSIFAFSAVKKTGTKCEGKKEWVSK